MSKSKQTAEFGAALVKEAESEPADEANLGLLSVQKDDLVGFIVRQGRPRLWTQRLFDLMSALIEANPALSVVRAARQVKEDEELLGYKTPTAGVMRDEYAKDRKKKSQETFKGIDASDGPRLISISIDSKGPRMPNPASLDLRRASPRWAQLTDRLAAIARERDYLLTDYFFYAEEAFEKSFFGDLQGRPADSSAHSRTDDERTAMIAHLRREIAALDEEKRSIVEPSPGNKLSALEEARREGSKQIRDVLRPTHDLLASRYTAAVVELALATDAYETFIATFRKSPFDWHQLGLLKQPDQVIAPSRSEAIRGVVGFRTAPWLGWAQARGHLKVETPDEWLVEEYAHRYRVSEDE